MLVVIFLKKLAIFKENLPAMREHKARRSRDAAETQPRRSRDAAGSRDPPRGASTRWWPR